MPTLATKLRLLHELYHLVKFSHATAPLPAPAGMPSEFAIAGYKPSTYCIVSTGNATLIELRDFTW